MPLGVVSTKKHCSSFSIEALISKDDSVRERGVSVAADVDTRHETCSLVQEYRKDSDRYSSSLPARHCDDRFPGRSQFLLSTTCRQDHHIDTETDGAMSPAISDCSSRSTHHSPPATPTPGSDVTSARGSRVPSQFYSGPRASLQTLVDQQMRAVAAAAAHQHQLASLHGHQGSGLLHMATPPGLQLCNGPTSTVAGSGSMHRSDEFNPFYSWLLSRHGAYHRMPGYCGEPTGLLFPFRKPKRIRTAFSPSQLLQLEDAFAKNHYVVGQERKDLAASLNLTETQVKVWFQNRRTKHKRVQSDEGGCDDQTTAAPGDASSDDEYVDVDSCESPSPQSDLPPSPPPADSAHSSTRYSQHQPPAALHDRRLATDYCSGRSSTAGPDHSLLTHHNRQCFANAVRQTFTGDS